MSRDVMLDFLELEDVPMDKPELHVEIAAKAMQGLGFVHVPMDDKIVMIFVRTVEDEVMGFKVNYLSGEEPAHTAKIEKALKVARKEGSLDHLLNTQDENTGDKTR